MFLLILPLHYNVLDHVPRKRGNKHFIFLYDTMSSVQVALIFIYLSFIFTKLLILILFKTRE